jgi:Fe-S cluster assembly protein SufB
MVDGRIVMSGDQTLAHKLEAEGYDWVEKDMLRKRLIFSGGAKPWKPNLMPTSTAPVGDFHYDVDYEFDAGTGLTEKTIDYICDVRKDPDSIREFREEALRKFDSSARAHPLGESRSGRYRLRQYPLLPLRRARQPKRSWDDVPKDVVKRTSERLGIPEQERKFLAGVEAQFDSEAAYSNIKAAVGEQGVIFVGSTEGLHNHPEIFKKWFGKVIPTGDNEFSAIQQRGVLRRLIHLHPAGSEGETPAPSLSSASTQRLGQFERTLIIADEGSEVMYGRLHRAEIRDLHTPQRRRGTRRPQGCQNPIHHRAELVGECFQSRDQTRSRP